MHQSMHPCIGHADLSSLDTRATLYVERVISHIAVQEDLIYSHRILSQSNLQYNDRLHIWCVRELTCWSRQCSWTLLPQIPAPLEARRPLQSCLQAGRAVLREPSAGPRLLLQLGLEVWVSLWACWWLFPSPRPSICPCVYPFPYPGHCPSLYTCHGSCLVSYPYQRPCPCLACWDHLCWTCERVGHPPLSAEGCLSGALQLHWY